MCKDVKRSLLLWPLAASAAIVGISWLANSSRLKSQDAAPTSQRADGTAKACLSRGVRQHHWDTLAVIAPTTPQVLHRNLTPIRPLLPPLERQARGIRAMTLPGRVESVLKAATLVDASRAQLRAPRLGSWDEQSEPGVTFSAVAAPEIGVDKPMASFVSATNPAACSPWRLPLAQSPQLIRPTQLHRPMQGCDLGRAAGADLFSSSRPHRPLVINTDLAQLLLRDRGRAGAGGECEPLGLSLMPPTGVPRACGSIGVHPLASSAHCLPTSAASLLPMSAAPLRMAMSPLVVSSIRGPESNRNNRFALVSRAAARSHPGTWPLPRELNRQLKTLAQPSAAHRGAGDRDQLAGDGSTEASASTAAQWASDVAARLSELQSLQRLGDARAGDVLAQLAEDAARGERLAEQEADRELQQRWLIAAHGLSRRVVVWQAVWCLVEQGTDPRSGEPGIHLYGASLPDAVADLREHLALVGDDAGWADYLLLDEIDAAAATGNQQQRAALAQRLLSRLDWYMLDPRQREFLDHVKVEQLADAIRGWTHSAIDYVRLLGQLEQIESDTIDLSTRDVADAVQTLRYAEKPQAVAVAHSINTNYRNANVRLAISEPMLRRMLPAVQPQTLPVRASLLGNQIRGTSRVKSDLQLSLRPSPDSWTVELQTLGNAHTHTISRNGPVAVRTSGDAVFHAATSIAITPRGIHLSSPAVRASGDSQLLGIESRYDAWPLIGPLVRGIAQNRFEDLKPAAARMASRQVRQKVGREIDQRVSEQMDRASEQFGSIVLAPLQQLHLDPTVVAMRTTDDQLLARYRVAGDWQLAAFTPRPREPEESLMSVQVHQSALNNTIEQLIPHGETQSIGALVRNVAGLFGGDGAALPDDLPEDVSIQFAPTRPITVEIDEGRVRVTVRVMQLTRDSMELSRFIVQAVYRPEVNGLNASLVRDGHLRVSGPSMSMRERIPVRAIFNKVFSTTRPLPLMLPRLAQHPGAQDLVVNQLELRDGWLGLAVSEPNAPRIALDL